MSEAGHGSKEKDEDKQRTFTPVFDDIADEMGLIGAAVYGVIWRHQQMRHGYAHLGVTRMRQLLEISRRTVQRHLRELEAQDLIQKVSASTGSRPAGYVTVPRKQSMAQETKPTLVSTVEQRKSQTMPNEGRQKVTPWTMGMTESPPWDDAATPKDTIRIQDGPQDTPPQPPRDGGVGGAEACASAPGEQPPASPPSGAIADEAPVRARKYEVSEDETYSLRRQAKALQGGRRFSSDASQLREAAYEYGAKAVEDALMNAQRLGVRTVIEALELLGVEDLTYG